MHRFCDIVFLSHRKVFNKQGAWMNDFAILFFKTPKYSCFHARYFPKHTLKFVFNSIQTCCEGYINRYNPAINHTRNLDLEGGAADIPWPIFTVHPHECSRYRFRIVSAVNLHCPIQFSIEDHLMTVISTDGAYIHPEKDISSLTLSNGERYDLKSIDPEYISRF